MSNSIEIYCAVSLLNAVKYFLCSRGSVPLGLLNNLMALMSK